MSFEINFTYCTAETNYVIKNRSYTKCSFDTNEKRIYMKRKQTFEDPSIFSQVEKELTWK